MGFVEIDFRGPLVRYGKEDGMPLRYKLPVDKEVTVQEMLNDLAVPLRHVGLVSVNGLKAGRSSLLREGDSITVFPVVAGG